MPQFTIKTSRSVMEFVEFTVEAEDEDEAREKFEESDDPWKEFSGEVTGGDYDSFEIEEIQENLDEDEVMGDHVCDDDCRSNGCDVYLGR